MFESLEPGALVAVIESTHRQESMLVARRLAAVAALLGHRLEAQERAEQRDDHAVIDGFAATAAEVAAAMNLSATAAGFVVSDAAALDTRLPRIAALLADGHTDWRTVRLIISRTALVTDDERLAQLDASLAERIGSWHSWSRRRVVNAVDAAVRAVDPDAARERRLADAEARYLGITAVDNGMAEIKGKIAAAAAAALDARLAQLAAQLCPQDPRTPDQRRADALGALGRGERLGCACARPDCPATTDGPDRDRGAAQVVITVVATEATVFADSEQPGYLHGYGLIDAEQVRDLARAASLLIADPAASAAQALRYQPGAALERAVRSRDLTCRFPGCDRPATICDVDHTIPFNHQDPAAGGQTVADNLKCLCRQHHRLKTFGGWRDVQLGDGTVIWTSPTGATYRPSPAGAELFGLPRTPACAAPAPRRRSRSRQRNGRIAAARNHNREQRPLNQARRSLKQAREQEIAARKFRNHMRDMLFLFKGKPSTSPYCTWVNDPREPEELPPDWTPGQPATPTLPDEPPF